MLTNLTFLDYVWRGLIVGTLVSTATLLVTAMVFVIQKKRYSPRQMKWTFNSQVCLLLLACVGSFVLVAVGDPELASGCFNQFVLANSSLTMTRVISAIWLVSVVFLAMTDICRIFLQMKNSNRFRPLKNGRTKTAFEKSVSKMGLLNKKIELYSSVGFMSPFVWGIFRYKVVVPQVALHSLSEKDLKHIFAHELSHIKDRDAIWLLLDLCCKRLLFFHPLVHFISQRHQVLMEKAADEQAVMKGGIRPGDLLKSLVEVVSLCQTQKTTPMVMHASRNFREIQERIISLGQNDYRFSSKMTFVFTIACTFLLSLGFSLAQARMVIGEATESSSLIGKMCSQVNHEKIIESWLNIEPVKNKCEK